MSTDVKLERIPMPDKMPLIGNVLSVDKDAPLQGLMQLSRELGPIYRMDMMGTPMVMVSGHELVAELCDESRFDKAVRGALRRVRAIGGNALFTGDTHDPEWGKAHRILLPTFGRQAMNNYMPMMLDVADQLMLKWERLNSDDEIDVVHDMTGVALDTIGICGFNYRFNSFYREGFHPFIDALSHTLETCMMQRGLPFESQMLKRRLDRMQTDVEFMNTLVDDIIAERRQGGGGKAVNDLLNFMLEGVDKKTGEALQDENIRFQINTFLIAGHETTSGLMAFTLYYLMNHPDVLERAVAEVDRVLGRDIAVSPTLKQVNQLTYVQQVLFEALRLWPTAPAFSLSPYNDEIIGGKYKIKAGTFVTVLVPMLHRDVTAWGENAEAFDPENFSKEALAKRPDSAYKPFGNGQRACIGRQFAIQEATLIIGMILQRFELIDHTNYELKIKESLSIKPDNLKMRVRLRDDVVRSRMVSAGFSEDSDAAEGLSAAAQKPSHGTPALVLYGSNLGSTEDFAREAAREAEQNGFDVTLAPLDDYAGKLPKSGAVLIACSSYNGSPPDNAAAFMDWLGTAEDGALNGVQYAVFGCGHSDWASTFQATPRQLDEAMERLGATRISGRGEGDAKDDIDEQFTAWTTSLWPDVVEALGLDIDLGAVAMAPPLYDVEVLPDQNITPLIEESGAKAATVLVNRELQTPPPDGPARSTRHIEVQLPEGVQYQTGDHLAVVPRNALDLVERVERRFGFAPETQIKLASTSQEHSQLPVGTPVSVRHVLTNLVELQDVASRKDVQTLSRYTECPHSGPQLEALAGDDYKTQVLQKRVSVLDLLEQFQACTLPFGAFLECMPMLNQRYYSISSAPMASDGTCSITVGVVDEPAISGNGQFKGVCSNHLAAQPEGAQIFVNVKATKDAFHLPEDPRTPVIMIGPGTGIAPFRGFLQQRAHLKAAGTEIGPAMLFFGCRHPDQDFLYRAELEGYDAEGIATLRTAFSRLEKSKTYVQDVLRSEREAVWDMLQAGAHVYVCGDGGRMEPDVRRALTLLYSEEMDASVSAAEAWLEEMMSEGRYALDVWVSS